MPEIRPRRPRLKLVLFAAVLVSLVGILTIALVREARTVSRPTAAASTRSALAPPRPPLAQAEEAYARALWPIHNEVKASAMRMTLAGIYYKIGEIGPAELRTRVQAANDVYRRAEPRIRQLQPPASLEKVHADYLEAVQLYQQSAAEMVRVFDDGRDDHLVVAFPKSKAAGQKLLQVGNALWPGEYLPN